MTDKIKLILYAAIPVILFFLAMFIKNQFQKKKILDIAQGYIKKELQFRQTKLQKLQEQDKVTADQVTKLQKQIDLRRNNLADKLQAKGLDFDSIKDLFQ